MSLYFNFYIIQEYLYFLSIIIIIFEHIQQLAIQQHAYTWYTTTSVCLEMFCSFLFVKLRKKTKEISKVSKFYIIWYYYLVNFSMASLTDFLLNGMLFRNKQKDIFFENIIVIVILSFHIAQRMSSYKGPTFITINRICDI